MRAFLIVLALAAAPLRAAGPDTPFDRADVHLESSDLVLLGERGYGFDDKGQLRSPKGAVMSREDTAYLLEDLRSRRKLADLLEIKIIQDRTKAQGVMTGEDRARLRTIAQRDWGLLPKSTQAELKPLFGDREMAELIERSPKAPLPDASVVSPPPVRVSQAPEAVPLDQPLKTLAGSLLPLAVEAPSAGSERVPPPIVFKPAAPAAVPPAAPVPAPAAAPAPVPAPPPAPAAAPAPQAPAAAPVASQPAGPAAAMPPQATSAAPIAARTPAPAAAAPDEDPVPLDIKPLPAPWAVAPAAEPPPAAPAAPPAPVLPAAPAVPVVTPAASAATPPAPAAVSVPASAPVPVAAPVAPAVPVAPAAPVAAAVPAPAPAAPARLPATGHPLPPPAPLPDEVELEAAAKAPTPVEGAAAGLPPAVAAAMAAPALPPPVPVPAAAPAAVPAPALKPGEFRVAPAAAVPPRTADGMSPLAMPAAPELKTPALPTAPAAPAGPAYPPVSAEEFASFVAGAPYGAREKALLALVAANLQEPERGRVLGVLVSRRPHVVVDSRRAGDGARWALTTTLIASQTPLDTVAVNDGPVFKEEGAFMRPDKVWTFPDDPAFFSARALPFPGQQAFSRESAAAGEQATKWGRARVYPDGSRRLTRGDVALAGALVHALLAYDARKRMPGDAASAELGAFTGEFRLYRALEAAADKEPAVDRETLALYREWRDRPLDFTDTMTHAAFSGGGSTRVLAEAGFGAGREPPPLPAALPAAGSAAQKAWLESEKPLREDKE